MASSSACAVGSRSCERAVAGLRQHLAVGAHHDRADGHFAAIARKFRLREREVHGPRGLATRRFICKLRRHERQSGGQTKPGSRPADGQGESASGRAVRHAHRQGDRPCRALLPARRRSLDRGRPRRRERQGAGHAGAMWCSRATRSPWTASHCPRLQPRGCGAITSRAASSPATRTRKGARPCSRRFRRSCPASSRSGGSTSTPRACCCSPLTASWRAISSCRARAGSGAIACGRMAASPRGARRACAKASPSTASTTGRSRRASTASKARISGSASLCAKARTAR